MSDFRVCRVCGYGKGFHIYLREQESGHRIGLVCPSCGQSFDVGWVVPDLAAVADNGTKFE